METEAWQIGLSGDTKKNTPTKKKIPFLIKNEVLMLMCPLISSKGETIISYVIFYRLNFV